MLCDETAVPLSNVAVVLAEVFPGTLLDGDPSTCTPLPPRNAGNITFDFSALSYNSESSELVFVWVYGTDSCSTADMIVLASNMEGAGHDCMGRRDPSSHVGCRFYCTCTGACMTVSVTFLGEAKNICEIVV